MSSLTSVMAADATWSSECFQQWLLLPPLARCLNICSNNCLCSTDTSGQRQNNVCDPNQGVSVNINEGGDRQFHQIMEHEREWFLLSVRRGFTQTPLSLLWKLSKKPRVSDSHSGRVFTISLQPVCWQKRVHWNSFYRCQIDLTMPFKIWQKIWQVLHLLVLLLASETLLFCEIVVRNPSFESYLSESMCLSQRLVCTLPTRV